MIERETIWNYENKDNPEDKHNYVLINNDFYICPKCNKINLRNEPCDCNKSANLNLSDYTHVNLSSYSKGVHIGEVLNAIVISYNPDKQIIRLRTNIIKYVGYVNKRAKKISRYETISFDLLKRRVLYFDNNKIRNITLKFIDTWYPSTLYEIINFLLFKDHCIQSSCIEKYSEKLLSFIDRILKTENKNIKKAIKKLYLAASGIYLDDDTSVPVRDIIQIYTTYNPNLTRYLRVKDCITEEDIDEFHNMIARKCVNPYNKSQQMPEIVMGLLQTENSKIYRVNKKEFLKYISKKTPEFIEEFTKICTYHRKYNHTGIYEYKELFDILINSFPIELAEHYMDLYTPLKYTEHDYNLIMSPYILKFIINKCKIPDKDDPDFLIKIFKRNKCPMTKENVKLFMKNPLYLYVYKVLTECGFKDVNHIKNIYNKFYELENLFNIEELENCIINHFHTMINKKSENIFARDLINTKLSNSTIIDTFEMLEKAENILNENELIARNGKSIYKLTLKEMHDELIFISEKIKNININLESKYSKTDKLLNDTINIDNDSFEVTLVKDTDEMIKIGQQLGICVGIAYRNKAINRACLIAGLKQGNNYVGCIELSSDAKSINQVKGYHNCYLHGNACKSIKVWKENHKLNVTTDDYENMSEDNNVIKYAYGNRDFQQADLDMLIDDPFQIAF